MADEMTCRIVGQLSDVILMLEDQLHELRLMRELLDDIAEDRQPTPKVVRNPPTIRITKKVNISEWMDGEEPHDLPMSDARRRRPGELREL